LGAAPVLPLAQENAAGGDQDRNGHERQQRTGEDQAGFDEEASQRCAFLS